jgi:hypothetical protein
VKLEEKMAVCEEVGPHQTPNLPTFWSWMSQFLELWEINFCSYKLFRLWYFVIEALESELVPLHTEHKRVKDFDKLRITAKSLITTQRQKYRHPCTSVRLSRRSWDCSIRQQNHSWHETQGEEMMTCPGHWFKAKRRKACPEISLNPKNWRTRQVLRPSLHYKQGFRHKRQRRSPCNWKGPKWEHIHSS